eukprot:2365391-Pleurochrysis_carterae.AAC.1
MLQLDFGCVPEINWISTADNVFADALSRQDDHRNFLDLVNSGAPPSGLVEPLPLGRSRCGILVRERLGSLGRKTLQT